MAVKVQVRGEAKGRSEDFLRRLDAEIVRRLARLGEECIRQARDRSAEESWQDQSGNLRSSIGYVIVRGGEVVYLSDFPSVGLGAEGQIAGRTLAEERARRHRHGYALVVVAGMYYAEYVEDMDDKDVLASTQLFARREARILLEGLASLKR